MEKYTLELMLEPPDDDGPWYCIWLNKVGGGATVAENIGDELLGRIMTEALNQQG